MKPLAGNGLKILPVISLNNRRVLITLICSLSFLTSCEQFGGAFTRSPEDIRSVSKKTQALIDRSLSDITPGSMRDYHTHVVGLSPDTVGTFVNEDWQSIFHPAGYIKFLVYKSAADIKENDNLDQQFMQRLDRLITYLPYHGRFGMMAFDYFHDEQGDIHKDLTTFHVPNTYVMKLVKEQPHRYFPILSIHPYRTDAVDKLEYYAERGVRYIKWLPNAMGIHPSPDKPERRQQLTDYYQVMKDYDMVLITHTGDEKATEAEEFQHLGNPAYLELPLSMKVKIVMAHVGSLGKCKPEESSVCKPDTPYLDIAINMMRDKQYRSLLFADISALTQFNRLHALDKVIEATDIHAQLVNGSDYPLPAVNFVIQTRALVKSGHITSAQRELINEIYHINPLLFDYVLKRTVAHSKTGAQLPAEIFMRNKLLPVSRHQG